MSPFNIYPAVDENYDFPIAIRRAIVASTEMSTALKNANWIKGSIAEGTDLNTLVTPGVYRISTTIPANLPPVASGAQSGFLTITNITGGNTTWALQEYVRYGNYNERWWRISRNTTGAWTTWNRLVSNDELEAVRSLIGGTEWARGAVPDNTDLNTFYAPGAYRISSSRPTNLPPVYDGVEVVSGFLTVTNSKSTNATWALQEFVRYGYASERWWRVSRNTAGAWGVWNRVANTAELETSNPVGGASLRNDLLVQDFTRRRGGIKSVSTGALSLRFDHGLSNFNTKIRPVLERLNLPYSLALCSGQWSRPENVGVTPEMVNAWVVGGLAEIWNHTKDHGAGDNSESQWKAAIDEGLAELRAQIPAAQIDGFAIPGSAGTSFGGFTNGNTVEQFFDTEGGRYILSRHAVSSGYIPGYKVLDGTVRQGEGHTTIDSATLSNIRTRVTEIQSTKRGLQLMLHPSLVDTATYMTTATMTSIFEYIAAERNAGRLAVLPPYDLLMARYDGK